MRPSSTMFLEKVSPFLEPFYWVVYRAVEAGLMQKYSYYADSRYSCRILSLSNMGDSGGEENSDGGYFLFSFSHVKFAFKILISRLYFS
jgi:hypothetical protein